MRLNYCTESSDFCRTVGWIHSHKNDAKCRQSQANDQLTEILVFGHQDTAVIGGHCQDRFVIGASGNFTDIHHIMSVCAQPVNKRRVATFIGHESHSLAPDACTISSLAR